MEKRKISWPHGIRTRTVHPVASCCTGPQTDMRASVKLVFQLQKFFDFAVPGKYAVLNPVKVRCHLEKMSLLISRAICHMVQCQMFK